MLEDDNRKRTNPIWPEHSTSHQTPFLERDMLRYGKEAAFELIVKSKSTTGVRLRISGGTRHSLISARHDAATDGTLTTTTHSIDDFPVFLSVEDPSETDVQGETFVSVSLRINKDVSLPLVSGSVYELKPLTYPSNTMRDTIPNRGEIGIVQSADPAVGDDVSLTLDDDEIWLVHWAAIQFVTDSTVTNRRILIRFKPTTSGPITIIAGALQGASMTRDHTYAQWGFLQDSAESSDLIQVMPANLWLEPSTVISTAVTGGQAGDDFGPLFIMREKFYTGT